MSHSPDLVPPRGRWSPDPPPGISVPSCGPALAGALAGVLPVDGAALTRPVREHGGCGGDALASGYACARGLQLDEVTCRNAAGAPAAPDVTELQGASGSV
jgi:hypothetical protein